MSENMRILAEELNRVETAIAHTTLYLSPGDASGYSDQLVDLVAREEETMTFLVHEARDDLAAE